MKRGRREALDPEGDLGRALRRLLDDLAVELGFSIASREREVVLSAPPTDVASLTTVIMRLEGLDPDEHEDLRRLVSLRIATRVGHLLRAGPEDPNVGCA